MEMASLTAQWGPHVQADEGEGLEKRGPSTQRLEQDMTLVAIRMKAGKHREIYIQTGIFKKIVRVGEAGEK